MREKCFEPPPDQPARQSNIWPLSATTSRRQNRDKKSKVREGRIQRKDVNLVHPTLARYSPNLLAITHGKIGKTFVLGDKILVLTPSGNDSDHLCQKKMTPTIWISIAFCPLLKGVSLNWVTGAKSPILLSFNVLL